MLPSLCSISVFQEDVMPASLNGKHLDSRATQQKFRADQGRIRTAGWSSSSTWGREDADGVSNITKATFSYWNV